MQAGLSVAAQIMHRRHSTSVGMSSDDEEPEGSDKLTERWNNNVAGMSIKQRSLLEGILSKSPTLHKVADSSAPVPPLPSFPRTVAQRRWPPLPHPHAAVPTSAPSSADSVWRLRPVAAAVPTLSQPQQRQPKQKGARSRSLDSLGTETASGSAPLWRAEAGGIRLRPRRWCVLALVVIPAAAVVAALGAVGLWRWPLAAIAAHGGPTRPFGGGLVVPRSGDQRGQHVAAWSDKPRGSTDMDLAQQVLRVLLRIRRFRVGDQGR